MNMQDSIDRLDRQIETLQKQRGAMLILRDKLADFPAELQVSTCNECLDFDNLSRADTIRLITHLKTGKWNKVPSSVSGKIDYRNTTFLPGITLRLWGAEPPASCRLVEEDVEIPAQPARTEKRLKLVCKEYEDNE
jgi:hypothetical protein